MAVGFGKYIAYRILNGIVILFFAVLIMSALFTKVATIQAQAQVDLQTQMWINDYIQTHGEAPSEEQIAAYREYLKKRYGLTKSYLERVWMYTIDTFTFQWGQSNQALFGTHDVKSQIKTALGRTVILFTTAQIIIILIGITLGTKCAQKPGSLLDRTVSILAMFTTSLPTWWLGMLMILVFVFYLGLLPVKLYSQVYMPHWSDLLKKMTLPVLTLVVVAFGGWSWIIRNIMIGTMQEDFIMVARAKGVPERKVIYGHALRASAPPIVTMIIFAMLGSMGGAIITEIIFNWPGMGRLYWQAIQANAVRTMMALNYMFAFIYVFAMVLADILYGYLDPRVRVGAAARS
jgi:peptide/nickel transport system permease protein